MLQESKKKMIKGFKLLTESLVPEPLFKLDQLLSRVDSLLEPHLNEREEKRTLKSIFTLRSKNVGEIGRSSLITYLLGENEIGDLMPKQNSDKSSPFL